MKATEMDTATRTMVGVGLLGMMIIAFLVI